MAKLAFLEKDDEIFHDLLDGEFAINTSRFKQINFLDRSKGLLAFVYTFSKAF